MIGRRADDAQSFNEAWSGRAPRDEQIAELVRFAETLCEAAVAEPTPEFRLSLRSSLMTEAQTALVSLGLGLLLSALNVAFRDFKYTIPFLVQIWLFATPSVYMSSCMSSPTTGLQSIVAVMTACGSGCVS